MGPCVPTMLSESGVTGGTSSCDMPVLPGHPASKQQHIHCTNGPAACPSLDSMQPACCSQLEQDINLGTHEHKRGVVFLRSAWHAGG